jgi:hypothetical protein
MRKAVGADSSAMIYIPSFKYPKVDTGINGHTGSKVIT